MGPGVVPPQASFWAPQGVLVHPVLVLLFGFPEVRMGRNGLGSPSGPCAPCLGHCTDGTFFTPSGSCLGSMAHAGGVVPSLQGAAAVCQPTVGEAPAGCQGLPELSHTGAFLAGGVAWPCPVVPPFLCPGLTVPAHTNPSCLPSWWPV